MDNIFSIYTLIYLPMAFSVFVRDFRYQRYLVFFWIIVLTLFRGLRWNLGTDWYWYAKSFEDIDSSNFLMFVTAEDIANTKILEQGWATLMLLSKFIYPYYTSFLLISNILLLIIYYKIAKLLTHNVLPCFVFLIFLNQFFPVRQTFGVAFFFWGVCLLLRNRGVVKASLSIILGVFFHYSTLFVTPYLIILKKNNLNYFSCLSILFFSFILEQGFDMFIPLLVSVANIVGMGWLIEAQIDEVYEVHSVFGSLSTFISGLFFVSYIYYWGLYKVPRDSVQNDVNYRPIMHVLISMMVWGYSINIIFLRNITYVARMASYFEMAMPVAYTVMYEKQKGEYRKCSLFIMFAFLLYRYFFKMTTYLPDLHFPYNSIFD